MSSLTTQEKVTFMKSYVSSVGSHLGWRKTLALRRQRLTDSRRGACPVSISPRVSWRGSAGCRPGGPRIKGQGLEFHRPRSKHHFHISPGKLPNLCEPWILHV